MLNYMIQLALTFETTVPVFVLHTGGVDYTAE